MQRRAPQLIGTHCDTGWQRPSRIALVSEWDSFYSRALSESFKSQVAQDAGIDSKDQAAVNDWVLRFSYLRGVDGRLPEEAASGNKAPGSDDNKNSKDKNTLDLSPLEKSDGNSQLDYLRRLADHIAREDEAYRRKGTSGIGAIGVLGADTYDKLLVLQALKGRMPNKVFFSTNLDARMLQRGQAQTTRNLVLAAPYGLTLTRALQQDVPPFRESLQSAVFIAILAAQSPGPTTSSGQSSTTNRSCFRRASMRWASAASSPCQTRRAPNAPRIARHPARPGKQRTTSWRCVACRILRPLLIPNSLSRYATSSMKGSRFSGPGR